MIPLPSILDCFIFSFFSFWLLMSPFVQLDSVGRIRRDDNFIEQ